MSTLGISSDFYHMLTDANDAEEIRRKLTAMAETIGVVSFRQKTVQEIMKVTRPDRVIPDAYSPYRALVRDGIHYFLSHISFDRFLDVLVCQLLMDPLSATEARLLELAKLFPTLHKLGQIIARNQNIAPDVRQWLIQLENGQYGTAPDLILAHINSRLHPDGGTESLHIEPVILSEASVGAVIPFKWHADSNQTINGVFKVLKPDIRNHLDEELAVFEQTALYFEKHRQQYAFNNFQFLDVFKEVSITLKKEVNLVAEQSHLSEAALCFSGTDHIVIPDLITLCDETMTAMGYIDGEKITDARLTNSQRRDCANILADALICRPLFSTDKSALFHGDPHAGNIMVSASENDSDKVKIALLDWSLAGHLSRGIRGKLVRLIKNVILEDMNQISDCIFDIADGGTGKRYLAKTEILRFVREVAGAEAHSGSSLIRKTFRLLELISYEGLVFPSELMLFRKAIFTLEGILFELDPQFDLDLFVFKHMAGLLAQEMPRRFGNVLFLQSDHAENYQSHLSNSDLQALMLQQYANVIKQNTRVAVDLLNQQNQFMRGFFH